MISLVLSAFEHSGYDIIIVASPRTPFTMNWARVHGFEFIRASGHGYIQDLQEAVKTIEETGSFFPVWRTSPVSPWRISSKYVRHTKFLARRPFQPGCLLHAGKKGLICFIRSESAGSMHALRELISFGETLSTAHRKKKNSCSWTGISPIISIPGRTWKNCGGFSQFHHKGRMVVPVRFRSNPLLCLIR